MNRSDDFNRANNASSLGSPSDGGSAWSALAGTWGIASNKAFESASTSQAVAVLDAATTSADAQATIGAGADCGLVVRAADSTNYILFVANGATSVGVVYKRVAGSFTQLGSTATITAGAGSVIKLSVDSSNAIRAYIDGVLKIGPNTDAAGSTNTKHGIRVNADPSLTFDDFSITDTAGGGGATAATGQLMLLGVGN